MKRRPLIFALAALVVLPLFAAAPAGIGSLQSAATPQARLRILLATAEEELAHIARMEKIGKKSGGRAIWPPSPEAAITPDAAARP